MVNQILIKSLFDYCPISGSLEAYLAAEWLFNEVNKL